MRQGWRLICLHDQIQSTYDLLEGYQLRKYQMAGFQERSACGPLTPHRRDGLSVMVPLRVVRPMLLCLVLYEQHIESEMVLQPSTSQISRDPLRLENSQQCLKGQPLSLSPLLESSRIPDTDWLMAIKCISRRLVLSRQD